MVLLGLTVSKADFGKIGQLECVVMIITYLQCVRLKVFLYNKLYSQWSV